jgi:hypothetical protein
MITESKRGVFKANIEEYYSKKDGIIYYHQRLLIPGRLNRWRRSKTSLKVFPNIDYERVAKEESLKGLRKAIDILEAELLEGTF